MVLPPGGLTPGAHSDRAPWGCDRLLSVAQVCAVSATERSPQRAAGKGQAMTEALNRSIALVYLLAFAIAIYYRITISDWLAAHLPL